MYYVVKYKLAEETKYKCFDSEANVKEYFKTFVGKVEEIEVRQNDVPIEQVFVGDLKGVLLNSAICYEQYFLKSRPCVIDNVASADKKCFLKRLWAKWMS